MRTSAPIRRVPALLLALGLMMAGVRPAEAVDYQREIKPLLRDRCYACHGALQQKSALRLDTVAGMLQGGKGGPVLRPGEPDRSSLLERVAASDPDDRMPPEHEGERLTAAQIAVLRQWIADGAVAPAGEAPEADPRAHWAFRPIQRPVVPPGPPAGQGRWARNPIDALVARQHAANGLTAQPEALREVLLRRLSFDLIGVPPTSGEIAEAQQATGDGWYEAAVDRLLSDPRHGERWARHWMDVWRYCDWWGLGEQLRNSQQHIWHWRDWIIESLNADMPYDEMLRLMLAADELHPEDLGRLRATGYLARNWFLFNRHQWMEETVEHVGKSLLGLTLNCAKCHDHKYDPIPQRDFYRLRAVFEPYHVRLDVLPGEPDLERDGLPRVFDSASPPPTYRFVRGQENQPDKSVVIEPGIPAFLTVDGLGLRPEPVALPLDAWQPERRPWVIDDELAAARRKIDEAGRDVPKLARELATALRHEAGLLERPAGATHSGAMERLRMEAAAATGAARGSLGAAEAGMNAARAELAAVEARAIATRAIWSRQDGDTNDLNLLAKERETAAVAVRAERAAALARARQTVADSEQRLAKAPADRRAALEKELLGARDALAKADQLAAAPVKPQDAFRRFSGARWTATRFLNSTADDPPVSSGPQSTGRRAALAAWITDRRNPLTARVAVNHIWMRHLGAPLVATVFEFGRKGTPPTHPELLDWLAAEFIESGWSMKHLHRLIVLSSTYRLSSSLAGAGDNPARDPDNRHLWRRAPIRLEGEAVRDALVSLAGTMDFARGGPPVPPAKQAESSRRSLYFFHSNNDRNLFLTTFDAPAVKECYRRDQSIVPQQALALTNGRLVHDAADRIAARLSAAEASDAGPPDDATFIRRAFACLLGITAADAEVAASQRALEAWRRLEVDPKPATAAGPDADPARSRLIHALINHNDFVTLR